MTTSPAEELAVVDNLRCRKELETLEVAWPRCVVFGPLDVLMFAEFGSCTRLESLWTRCKPRG